MLNGGGVRRMATLGSTNQAGLEANAIQLMTLVTAIASRPLEMAELFSKAESGDVDTMLYDGQVCSPCLSTSFTLYLQER